MLREQKVREYSREVPPQPNCCCMRLWACWIGTQCGGRTSTSSLGPGSPINMSTTFDINAELLLNSETWTALVLCEIPSGSLFTIPRLWSLQEWLLQSSHRVQLLGEASVALSTSLKFVRHMRVWNNGCVASGQVDPEDDEVFADSCDYAFSEIQERSLV